MLKPGAGSSVLVSHVGGARAFPGASAGAGRPRGATAARSPVSVSIAAPVLLAQRPQGSWPRAAPPRSHTAGVGRWRVWSSKPSGEEGFTPTGRDAHPTVGAGERGAAHTATCGRPAQRPHTGHVTEQIHLYLHWEVPGWGCRAGTPSHPPPVPHRAAGGSLSPRHLGEPGLPPRAAAGPPGQAPPQPGAREPSGRSRNPCEGRAAPRRTLPTWARGPRRSRASRR